MLFDAAERLLLGLGPMAKGAVREHRFSPPRRWRFDIAWPELFVAVEIEGGVWTGGRHVRGLGYENDLRKYNAANRLGWHVFRYTPKMVLDGDARLELEEVFRG